MQRVERISTFSINSVSLSEDMKAGVHMLTADTPFLETILESITSIHASCIMRDHTMASFLPPLSQPQMLEHWRNLCDEAGSQRIILVYLDRVVDRTALQAIEAPFECHDWLYLPPDHHVKEGEEEGQESKLEVAGVVSLSTPASETGPFRGLVQKLFVSPFHRRKGIATRLVAELEKHARKRDRWSLMLDTTVGTPAEHLYPRLGYRKLGVVKEYGYTPKDHSLVDEIFFWKDLRTD